MGCFLLCFRLSVTLWLLENPVAQSQCLTFRFLLLKTEEEQESPWQGLSAGMSVARFLAIQPHCWLAEWPYNPVELELCSDALHATCRWHVCPSVLLVWMRVTVGEVTLESRGLCDGGHSSPERSLRALHCLQTARWSDRVSSRDWGFDEPSLPSQCEGSSVSSHPRFCHPGPSSLKGKDSAHQPRSLKAVTSHLLGS